MALTMDRTLGKLTVLWGVKMSSTGRQNSRFHENPQNKVQRMIEMYMYTTELSHSSENCPVKVSKWGIQFSPFSTFSADDQRGGNSSHSGDRRIHL